MSCFPSNDEQWHQWIIRHCNCHDGIHELLKEIALAEAASMGKNINRNGQTARIFIMGWYLATSSVCL
jgi:hypothetical protein